jgi:hypothetical protein
MNKTISEVTIHKVFKYGTHEQLENSVNRWLKNGIAVKTDNKWYKLKDGNFPNAQEIEISVRGRYGSPTWKACAVVVKDPNGWWLLAGSV